MALDVTDLTITYPSPRGGEPTRAVDRVSLHLGAGQIIALLGPSGCGKSSLLRAVAGLETPASGTVTWDGVDLAGVPTHERGFGLMFQEGQLFPHRNVGGNVAFGLEMAGMPKGGRRHRVNELLELVGLAGYVARRVDTLSGGEQQRVALARALAPRPRLLLLDEPLSALDRHLREHLGGELAGILRASGTTALYVTHDHDEAFTVADEIALMSAGVIRQLGTPAQVWAAPVDAEAARFLGYRIVSDGDAEVGLGPRALEVVPEAARTGVVTAVGIVRGEIIADVDLPGWGSQRAICSAPVAVGERVGVHVRGEHVARFGAARFGGAQGVPDWLGPAPARK